MIQQVCSWICTKSCINASNNNWSEVIMQMEMANAYPDIVIGCSGGGSNLAGISFPFIPEKIKGKDTRLIAVEPAAFHL